MIREIPADLFGSSGHFGMLWCFEPGGLCSRDEPIEQVVLAGTGLMKNLKSLKLQNAFWGLRTFVPVILSDKVAFKGRCQLASGQELHSFFAVLPFLLFQILH